MWMEEVNVNGKTKYKFFERYQDPYTEKLKRVSVTLTSKSNQAKKEATNLLQSKIDKLLKKPKNLKELTFSKAFDEYTLNYKRRVKETSYNSLLSIKKAILACIGADTLVSNINQSFLTEQIEKAYYEKKLAYNTVKKIKWFTIATLKYIQAKGYPVTIPNDKIKLTIRPKETAEKYLEKWELRTIIEQLRDLPQGDRKADMAEFLSLTGLRYGELVALREQDLYEGYIKITGTIAFNVGKYSEVVRTPPKTEKSIRSVSLPDRAVNILIKTLQQNEFLKLKSEYINQGYIFTGENGNPIDYRNYRPALKNAVEKSKVDKPVTTHYFRHTHVSFLAELNVPIKAIMDRVGHKDSKTTLEIYSHVTQKMKDKLLEDLNNLDF